MTSVNAAYLQRNQRPTVSGLVVHPPGVVFQKPFSTGETEIAGYQSDVARAAPRQPGPAGAVDRHADARSAHLPEGAADAGLEGRRRQRRRPHLRRGLPPRRRQRLDDAGHRASPIPIYVWDTTAVPSGTYVVRIAASDAPSQAEGSALVGELESSVIEVDNTPPAVTAGTGRQGRRPGVGHRRGPRRPVGGVAAGVLARRRRVAAGLSGRRPARWPPRVGDPAARRPRRRARRWSCGRPTRCTTSAARP